MNSGDIFHNSPYQLHMKRNETCTQVCKIKLNADDSAFKTLLKAADTQPSYRVQIRIDNMPAIMMAQADENDLLVAIGKGYPLTTTYNVPNKEKGEDETVYALTNHVNFFILYHPLDAQILPSPQFSPTPSPINRIIRVYITSKSIDYNKVPISSCMKADADGNVPVIIGDNVDVTFTYSVKWIATEEKWATRWDELLEMTPEDYEMNWFAIVNSIAITTMLSFAVAVILLRAVKRDFALYNELDAQLQDEENIESEIFVTGWKVVARDVFRPPSNAVLLSIIAGTGDQVRTFHLKKSLLIYFTLEIRDRN